MEGGGEQGLHCAFFPAGGQQRLQPGRGRQRVVIQEKEGELLAGRGGGSGIGNGFGGPDTGDAGYLDENGYLFLVDRVKDMIVSGGENVYSAEVESAISTHPAVSEVAVIGIPHETWGEQVHAIVVLHEGATATEDEIRDHARAEIAGYKVPKSVEFRTDPLPLSGALKILKRELRAPYWERTDRTVN